MEDGNRKWGSRKNREAEGPLHALLPTSSPTVVRLGGSLSPRRPPSNHSAPHGGTQNQTTMMAARIDTSRSTRIPALQRLSVPISCSEQDARLIHRRTRRRSSVRTLVSLPSLHVVLVFSVLVSGKAFAPTETSNRDSLGLWAQKPRRFSQGAHKKSKPTQSSRSIDDLESALAQKFGTDLSKWTSEDFWDDDDDDDDEVEEGAPLFVSQHPRPVKDPWSKRERAPVVDTPTSVPEAKSHNNRRSESVARPSQSPDTSPSFFFRDTSTTNEEPFIPSDEPQPQRPKPEKKPLLLDKNGMPILITADQAVKDFRQFVGADMDLENNAPLLSTETRSWEELGVSSPQLLRNLKEMGCPSPLYVQEQSCGAAIARKDVLVGTYTGSGKTLSFLVPLIQQLLSDVSGDGTKAIIVAPGRELASQIMSVTRELLEGCELTTMLAIGGTTFSRNLEQIRKRKPDILVGTPGRLAELIVGKPGEKGGRLKIGSVRALVLDEFDALLDYKPHREPTRALVSELKRRHGDKLQSILCSATATDLIGTSKIEGVLRDNYELAMTKDDDVLVTGGSKKTRVSRTVIHGVIDVEHQRFALSTLRRILHTNPLPQQILIFVESSRKVKIVVEKLANMGIVAAPLHGGNGSEKADRADVSRALRDGYVGIVVATELAARGLDAPLLTHVINLDLPTDASHYAHRAGRCGRGGRPGVVVSLTTSPQERNVPRRFAKDLGIDIYTADTRDGKLVALRED